MFSVVIPLYNKELSIKNTLMSVLNQTFQDFEIVLVNDGSTDNSLAEALSIKDSRIRVIDKINEGVSSARNHGIANAKFEWICFLDADDLWIEDHLQTINQMRKEFPNDQVFCTSFVRSTENFPLQEDYTTFIIEDYFEEAIKYHFFWTSVTAINIKIFNDVGVFSQDLSRGEDLELWARIGMKYRFIRSSKLTAIYVQDSDNKLSFTKSAIRKSIINNISFKGLTNIQKSYYKKLIINKIKSCFIKGDISTAIKLLYKYNIKLI
jgi:glycosyltransferase involved in cell wall biosynthesis